MAVPPPPVSVTVGGTTLANLQAADGWNQWGQLPPVYAICSPCSGVNWSMNKHIRSVSLTGNATQFNIGGTTLACPVICTSEIVSVARKVS